MAGSPLLTTCTLVPSTALANMTRLLALQATLDGSAGLLFNVIGVGPSIGVDGEIVVVKIIYNASSCEVGGSIDGNGGSFLEFLMASKMPWQMAAAMAVMVILYMEKMGLVYPAISSSLFSLATDSRMSWRSRVRVGSFWQRSMRVMMCSSSLRRLRK